MAAGRFLVSGVALVAGADVALPDEVAHQARDVLRLAAGDTLWLLDGVGGEYPATLVTVDRKRVTARLGERVLGLAEPPVRITLCQGMLKAAKFEWVLQKGTELGVTTFIPLLTERAIAATEELGGAKLRRYERILAEAMEQCGGAWLPELATPRPLAHALASLPPDAIALIPWEEERATTLRAALTEAQATRAASGQPIGEIRLFIGPEGGFAAGEVALAQRLGATPVTLGRRILRAETAAIVAVTLALDAL
jgi:16S rRNA (uracil1498-N3)-methyltransferase